jgi:hypothetical protein
MLLPEEMPDSFLHPRTLARGIGAALALAAACDAAAASSVFNCGDTGTGSLRAAVGSAANGDTIDMSTLQCSSISLSTGSLNVSVDNLTLIGPATGLTVNGHSTAPYSPVFVHAGAGTLTVRNMTLQHGATTSPHGGCVSSNGNVVLDHANVNHCFMSFPNPASCPALGGGVYAKGNLTVLDSTVANNAASCYSGNPLVKVKEYGGGLFAVGNMTIRRSSITDNYVGGGGLSSFSYGYGGGLSLHGNLEITDSTIARNSAGTTNCLYSTFGNAGGIDVTNVASNVTITNSTITGNTATAFFGGIFTAGPLTLSNSTVAFNSTSAATVTHNGHDYAPGLHVQGTSANLQSSIIANNKFDSCTAGGTLTDLTGLTATITGANNLIMGSTVAPSGSLTADPQLQALADNGGPTPTHKLGAASPAIAHGNNAAGLTFDQRGSGFARTFAGVTDIGAFQTGDSPFSSGFE